MYRYYVVCKQEVVWRTDCPRDAHRMARSFTREKQAPAIVTRVVCKWEMQAVRTNGK